MTERGASSVNNNGTTLHIIVDNRADKILEVDQA